MKRSDMRIACKLILPFLFYILGMVTMGAFAVGASGAIVFAVWASTSIATIMLVVRALEPSFIFYRTYHRAINLLRLARSYGIGPHLSKSQRHFQLMLLTEYPPKSTELK